MTTSALALDGIRKRFGGVTALDGADLIVRPGTIHALLGENGAGKTTLMRVAYGLTRPNEGAIRVNGVPLVPRSPAVALAAGIGMVQQHFTLVPAMNAAENVALGTTSGRRLDENVRRLAGQLSVRLDAAIPVGELGVSEQQRVELLKALSRGARVLLLDEPTAALAPSDIDSLFSWLRDFRGRGGSVVLVTHKLQEALGLADDITVLRRGVVTWSGTRDSASLDTLVTAMVGEAVPVDSGTDHARSSSTGAVVVAGARALEIRDQRGVVRVRDANLDVRSGEIVGVAGVEGSGVRELMYALAGRRRPDEGTVRVPDDTGFVPDDRHQEALLMDQSIVANVLLRGAKRRTGWLRWNAAETHARRIVRSAGIAVSELRLPVSTLSGGNQQRLILARELDAAPPLIVAMNPTRGLDVAASVEVHRRLREARDVGSAVLYHSADLDEVLDVSDRVVVVYDGRLRETGRDREAVGRAMLGTA